MAKPRVEVRGPLDSRSIVIRLNDDNNQPLNGQTRLFFRKGRDRNSDIPVNLNGQDVVADVQNGEWTSQPMDLQKMVSDGYDTIVAIYQGQYGFGNLSDQRQQSGQNRSQGAGQKDDKPRIAFTPRKPEEIRDSGNLTGYHIAATGTTYRGKKPTSETVQFFIENEEIGTRTSDGNGNFSFTFRNIPPGGPFGDGIVTLRARIKDTDTEEASEARVPKEEKKADEKPKPADDIEVLQPHCCDERRRFLVTVFTRQGDKPVKGKFVIAASTPLKLFDIADNLHSEGYSIQLETEDNGQLQFFIEFAPHQTSVSFTLQNGKRKQHLFVRPPSADELKRRKEREKK